MALSRCFLIFVSLTCYTSVTSESVNRVTRDWGPWTTWSSCSHSCGYGTAYRIRRCHAAHRQGREQVCQGPSKQYQICNNRRCNDDQRSDYRTRECAKQNSVYYGHKTYVWEPYINSAAPCELSCKSVGHSYYARFKEVVDDGVICNEENTAVCMEGKCLHTGCDGVLGSKTPVDHCGVCGGDGSSCRFIRGIFTRTHLPIRAYSEVTTIPAGARNINITELSRSRNHLALSTSKGYFLNGGLRLQGEGQVHAAGTTFSYRTGSLGCNGECLQAGGPLNSSVKVEVISFGRNPGISYEFSVDQGSQVLVSGQPVLPKATNDDHRQLAVPESSRGDAEQRDEEPNRLRLEIIPRIHHGKAPIDATEHSVKKQFHQLQQHHHRRHQHVVHSTTPPPPAPGTRGPLQIDKSSGQKWEESRKIISAPYHGSPREKDRVHAKGDNTTFVYKHYYHTNELDDLGDVPMISTEDKDFNEAKEPTWLENDDNFDDDRLAEFSSTTQYYPPQQSSFPAVIAASLINQREKSQHASADRYHSSHDNRPTGSQDGKQSYSWRISGLTECSEPCGGGLQEPRLVCVREGSQIEVIPENCDESRKPSTSLISCNTQPCGARWHLHEWSPCSVTCGRGLQKRVIECQKRISPTLTISVSASSCPQPQPPSRQYCQLEPCFMWRASNWTKCSVECGFGQRKRHIQCVDGNSKNVSEKLCTQIKPDTEEICNMGSCAQGWFHSKWSEECSSKCGRGHYTRDVYCLAPDGSKLEEAKCGKSSKPHEQKSCKASTPCGGQWFAGPWSQCNMTCGSKSYRHREVFCIKHHGHRIHHIVKDHNCLKEDKPVQVEACGPLADCKPEWYMTAWTECTKSCGTGVKTREIKCLDGNLIQSADCDKSQKPSRRQPCNTKPCISNHVEIPTKEVTTSVDYLQMDWSAPVASTEHFSCSDSEDLRWCQLARRARLCHYQHYKKICCHTCHSLDPKPH
uniref:PLAC domain-containing protein n=1 Tax=Biomphalaria glabrata TaxID=6526 RepID=A0A2C9KG03_BIOGL